MLLDGQQKNGQKMPPPLPPTLIYIYEYWTCSLQRKVKIAENLNNDQTKLPIEAWLVSSWPLSYAVGRPTKKRLPPFHKKWLPLHCYIDKHWNFHFLLIIIRMESLNSNQTKPSILTSFMLTWSLWHAVRRQPKNAHLPLIKMTPMTHLYRWTLDFSFFAEGLHIRQNQLVIGYIYKQMTKDPWMKTVYIYIYIYIYIYTYIWVCVCV